MKKQINQKYFILNKKTLQESGVNNYQELWLKVKSDGFTGLLIDTQVKFEKKQAEEVENATYKMTFSDDKEDRHGDIVKQNWDLKWFKKNPVLLDSHNYDSITRIVGRVSKITQDPVLNGEIEFAQNELGQQAQYLVDNGFLNASSVGFIPLEFDNEGNITKSELLEISLVAVPANPRALFEKKATELISDIKAVEDDILGTDEVEEKEELKKELVKLNTRKDKLLKIKNALLEINKNEQKKLKRKLIKTLRNF